MIIQSLNGKWTLTIPGAQFHDIPAEVPGSVYHDLLRESLIPDPFYRDNEDEALRLMENTFCYSRSFFIDTALLSCSRVLLCCDGLDTLAEIRINGTSAGNADNMHRIWEYDIKTLLQEGENRIEICFSSPTRYIRDAYSASRADGSSDAMTGFPLLRKAHCMFGWDWGPRLPDAGIWRDIRIIGVETARIQDVLVLQDWADGQVTLHIQTHLERCSTEDSEVIVSVESPDGDRYTGYGEDCCISIQNPQLWWPAGFGAQPLYLVKVALNTDERESDFWERRIGLRTMTVSRRKDEWGESFCHCVNGVDIFAMGADYIPEDNLLPRRNPARTRQLLEDVRAANLNCIRVWG
ncbi:MAG: glycoside hydrolase family 2 protein, partial [Oscillospiraceae bacterium]|nr:glycoside hydrolase family 2 protein [Oscillospiraceae bacterium]